MVLPVQLKSTHFLHRRPSHELSVVLVFKTSSDRRVPGSWNGPTFVYWSSNIESFL